MDWLPIDCMICICEYLSPSDLSRFGRVCKLFYEASLVSHLWRQHSLRRWLFCNVFQVSAGPNRWKRYFLARRKVEASLDKGRPIRDYKVKTLRGHAAKVCSVTIIGCGCVNWEEPKPPLVVSLSEDRCIKAWDLSKGIVVWSRDGDVVSMATDSTSEELATRGMDGSVTLWNTSSWQGKTLIFPKLAEDSHSVAGGHENIDSTTFIKYGHLKNTNLPKTLLMVVCKNDNNREQLEFWDPNIEVTAVASPIFVLWITTNHDCASLQLNEVSELLAIPRKSGDVHIWNLSSLVPSTSPATPISPHVTISTSTNCIPHWISPGLLATYCATSSNIDLWNVSGYMTDLRRQIVLLNTTTTTMHTCQRRITCSAPPTSLSVANNRIIVGEISGKIQVFNSSVKCDVGVLQEFADHKGPVTDIYVDSYRVLSCSKDFSIRVYRWQADDESDAPPSLRGQSSSSSSSSSRGVKLESRYTLLGGSVAHKTHDGFNRVLCEASSCIGVAGDQLKFYNFSCQLELLD